MAEKIKATFLGIISLLMLCILSTIIGLGIGTVIHSHKYNDSNCYEELTTCQTLLSTPEHCLTICAEEFEKMEN